MTFDIVTGGNGFIGSHLVDALLAKGRQVLVIDKNENSKNLDHHKGNWRFKKTFRHITQDELPPSYFNGVERIFHLAALADIVPSIENPKAYFYTNVEGTLNVLEAAKKAGCKKFIYAASASCYGKESGAWNEVHPCNPAYPYALTKYLGEQLVLHWAKVYKIPAISLRLFNVYGLRSRTDGVYGAMFGTFLAQIANNEPVTIIGDGTQERDFVHISDVVNALIMAADSNLDGVYNVGSGDSISINKIAELLGAKNIINIPKRPGEPEVICACVAKIRHDLGWEAKVSIDGGITELLANISNWKDAKVWTPETIEKVTSEWFKCL